MILQALYQYYRQMREAGRDIAPPGMEWKAIPFVIELTPEGEFIQLADTRDKENKNGRKYLVSRSETRSGINSYQVAKVMWDHLGYVLGVSKDGTEKEEAVAPLQNDYFVKRVYLLKERYPENPHITAVARFYQDGHAESLKENKELIKSIQGLKEANISFRLPELGSDLVASIQDVEDYMDASTDTDEADDLGIGVCLVTGKRAPIARLHPAVKLAGAQATASLISFQPFSGFDSYGKKQGFNAPVSVQVAESIATALNDLLSKDRKTNYRVGDTAFVFWSSLTNQELIESYHIATFSGIAVQSDETDEEIAVETDTAKPSSPKRTRSAKRSAALLPTEESRKVLETLKFACGYKGKSMHKDGGRFYILGLAPYTARISIKLWAEGSIEEIVGNTLRHQYDMNIISKEGNVDAENPPLRSIFQIVKSVSLSDKSDKWSANLIQSLVESIVQNKPYPHILQQACLERIKHGKPVTELRAAILKAYINRKKQQEFITMALDLNQTNKAYLAGRLFALLENVQRCALGSTNTTIGDSHYNAASTTPRVVFGRLIALSKAHLSKLRKEKPGIAIDRERQIEELYQMLPGNDPAWPSHFSLDDQSIFAVGYYHQRTELWRKKEKPEDVIEESLEEKPFMHNDLFSQI